MASVRRDSRTPSRTAPKIAAHGPRAGRRLALGLAVRAGGSHRRHARDRFWLPGRDRQVVDAAQDQLFPGPSADPRITLVAIDQRSKDDLGAYPWLNSYHAKVINYLAGLHPRLILFDVVLDHDTPVDPENPSANPDAELASAIASARNVVLVCTADDAPRPEFSTVAAAVGERGFATPDAADSVRGVELRPKNTCP